MSGFSEDWLDYREPVDRRSRDQGLLGLLSARLSGKPVRVLDLGAGTGSNLRALAPFLGEDQKWTLVDNDLKLLLSAIRKLNAKRISSWEAMIEDSGLQIALIERNLACPLRADELQGFSLVTASALFDLYSKEAIKDLVDSLAELNIGFYTSLTYNGLQSWEPSHNADDEIIKAFLLHQQRDKGFGPAAGSNATAVLIEAFTARGYIVETADSPWILGTADIELLKLLESGIVQAVRETDEVSTKTLDDWKSIERTRAMVGHTDLIAWPRSFFSEAKFL